MGFAELLKLLFQKPLEKNRRKSKKEIAALSAKIEKLSRKISKLYDLFTDENISRDELSRKRTEYDGQIRLLKAQRDALETPHKKVFEKITAAIEMLKELPELYLKAAAPPQKIKILRKLAAGFTLDAEGILTLDWHAPYGLLMRRPELVEAIREESEEEDRLVGLRQKQAPAAPTTAKHSKRQRAVGKAASRRPSLRRGAAGAECDYAKDKQYTKKAAQNERPVEIENGLLRDASAYVCDGLDSSSNARLGGFEPPTF